MRIRDWVVALTMGFLLWSGIFAVLAHAETGLDVLGIAKINPRMVGQELDPNSAFGWLEETFGPAHQNVGIVFSSGKVTAARGHLRNGTCIRGGTCPNQYSDNRELERRAKSYAAFMSNYPGVKCYVSPWLEHDVKDKKLVEKWYGILRRVVPSCVPVCSAFTGYCPAGVLIERHGNKGRADIRSNDGDSLFDSDSSTYRTSGSRLTLGWIPEFNGRVSGEKEFTPPKDRINWAGRALVRQAVRVMRPMQPKPVTSCTTIQDPELFKTNAENYGKGKDDGRGNKGLFIARRIHSKIDIQQLSGRSVGCLKYYGPFDGGGFRHYVGSCSGETPVGLMDELGSEWGILRAGNQCWQFNAIRRLGYYR